MNKLSIVVRFFFFVLVVCLLVMGLFATLPVILLTAVVTTGFYLLVHGGIVNVAGHVLYGRDRDYQQYKRLGGDPFLDTLPRPINPRGDGELFYVLPYPEPDYSTFVPPPFWGFQCLACFARVEEPIGECWSCGERLG